MFRKYKLDPAVWHQKAISFEWDVEAGAIRGEDAEQVLSLIDSAVKAGSIVGHPYPTSFDITDPLHKISEMAVVLGGDWQLSDDLAAAYPVVEGESEISMLMDENGVEHSVTVIH